MLAKVQKTPDQDSPVEIVRKIVATVGKGAKLEALERERSEAMDAHDALLERSKVLWNEFRMYGRGINPAHAEGAEEYLAILPRLKAAEEALQDVVGRHKQELNGRHARKLEAALLPHMSDLADVILTKIADLHLQIGAFSECAKEIAAVGGGHFFPSDRLSALEVEMVQMIATAKTFSERSIIDKVLGQ